MPDTEKDIISEIRDNFRESSDGTEDQYNEMIGDLNFLNDEDHWDEYAQSHGPGRTRRSLSAKRFRSRAAVIARSDPHSPGQQSIDRALSTSAPAHPRADPCTATPAASPSPRASPCLPPSVL